MLIGDVSIPVIITMEKRSGSRFAFIKQGISMRLPVGISEQKFKDYEQKLNEWVAEVIKKKPTLLQEYTHKAYASGQILTLSGRMYTLDIRRSNIKGGRASLKQGTIFVNISEQLTDEAYNKALKTLLSRTIGADFLPEITQRVLDWNDKTFRQHVKSVNLKYNHSNWGSCSSASNINLSTRLLFTPPEIQDYVILHELAHLIEMNHSPRFWALVETHMPDYKLRRKWLRRHQAHCNF